MYVDMLAVRGPADMLLVRGPLIPNAITLRPLPCWLKILNYQMFGKFRFLSFLMTIQTISTNSWSLYEFSLFF